MGDLFHLIHRLVGRNVTMETDEQRIRPVGSEVERLLADNTKSPPIDGLVPRSLLKRAAGNHNLDSRTSAPVPG